MQRYSESIYLKRRYPTITIDHGGSSMLKYFFGLSVHLTDKTVHLDCKDQSWREIIKLRGLLKCFLLLSNFNQNRNMKTNFCENPSSYFPHAKEPRNLKNKPSNFCNKFYKALLISARQTDRHVGLKGTAVKPNIKQSVAIVIPLRLLIDVCFYYQNEQITMFHFS